MSTGLSRFKTLSGIELKSELGRELKRIDGRRRGGVKLKLAHGGDEVRLVIGSGAPLVVG